MSLLETIRSQTKENKNSIQKRIITLMKEKNIDANDFFSESGRRSVHETWNQNTRSLDCYDVLYALYNEKA